MKRVIEFIDNAKSQYEANEAFNLLSAQNGYLGGRILSPSPSKPGWRVQVFFDARGVPGKPGEEIMAGAHIRLLPDSMARQMGIWK